MPWRSARPFLVGLTGGIGSGKSAAARCFAEQGVPVIDTDQIARSLTLPGGAALPAIAEAFGQDVLLADGGLDRARMRARVFADPAAKKRLEAITHPLIEAEVRRRIAASTAPYLVVDIPLLVETDARRRYVLDQVLVIDCP
ncbi:MAG: dephospho-CoA kinase, partial [Zoogloeaceae bacterium]|nr:dephospho-CoA kinase [Zoogloeaceae bacterium]